MRRKTTEQVQDRIQSRKLARAMALPSYRGRHIRRAWDDVARTYAKGRYRWMWRRALSS